MSETNDQISESRCSETAEVRNICSDNECDEEKQKTPSGKILRNAIKLRSKDWADWAGNRYSREAWDLMNPIDIRETDYLMLGLLKYLDDNFTPNN